MSIFHKDIIRGPAAPPPPPLREVHLSVWGQGVLIGDRVTGARLIPEPTGIAIIGSHIAENRLAFVLPTGTPYGWGAQLHLAATGYQPLDARVFLAPDLDMEMLSAAPAIPPAEGLVVAGAFFTTVSGKPYSIIGCSDFQLFQRFLLGEPIDPILQQRRDLGFNDLRVFLMCQGMFHLYPQESGGFYDSLDAFCFHVGQWGFTAEATIFADATMVMPALRDQQTHAEQVYAVLRKSPWMRAELVNENDQRINHIDTSQFAQPAGLLWSRGSNGSQATPCRPWGSYETFHTNGASGWWRKGHNGMELSAGAEGIPASHVPVVVNEQTRPDRDGNLAHFREAGAVEALLIAGGVYHCNGGKASVPFTGLDHAGAVEFVAGATSVPLSCRGGAYALLNRGEANAGERRVYTRGGTPACTVTTSRS